MKDFNPFAYEQMMVQAAGGLPSAKPVVQNEPVEKASVQFVVQDDLSFRDSFFEMLMSRKAAVRFVV